MDVWRVQVYIGVIYPWSIFQAISTPIVSESYRKRLEDQAMQLWYLRFFSAEKIWWIYVDFFHPRKLTFFFNGKKNNDLDWRCCISYEKWWFSSAILVFWEGNVRNSMIIAVFKEAWQNRTWLKVIIDMSFLLLCWLVILLTRGHMMINITCHSNLEGLKFQCQDALPKILVRTSETSSSPKGLSYCVVLQWFEKRGP